ncbi:MAG: AAA family ATPase, partial [Gammaproteobacteria bacterium]|nr:AAA family ATPase [Gammaproteobacteria bacterium]
KNLKMTANASISPQTALPGSQPAISVDQQPAGIVLQQQPFDNTRDSNYFFASSGHAEALSRLNFLVEDRNMGIGLLTGEIGCGKTVTRTMLHRQLARPAHIVVSLENCLLEFDDLLLEIISQMRSQRATSAELPDRYSRLSAFKQILMRQVAESNRHLVIMLDEAQQLSQASIEALKGLTNITSERQNFLTLILIGQPELRNTIRQLRQVDQRVSLRYHLNAMSHDETRCYLEHRLQVAGLQGPTPFDADAVRLLFEASGGVPREINRICKLALDHARANGLTVLDAGIINSVTDDLRTHGGLLDPCVMPS